MKLQPIGAYAMDINWTPILISINLPIPMQQSSTSTVIIHCTTLGHSGGSHPTGVVNFMSWLCLKDFEKKLTPATMVGKLYPCNGKLEMNCLGKWPLIILSFSCPLQNSEIWPLASFHLSHLEFGSGFLFFDLKFSRLWKTCIRSQKPKLVLVAAEYNLFFVSCGSAFESHWKKTAFFPWGIIWHQSALKN